MNSKTGKAIRGADVILKDLAIGEFIDTTTDENGVFFFWSLKVRRTYEVRIKANAYLPIDTSIDLTEEYLDLKNTRPRATLTI